MDEKKKEMMLLADMIKGEINRMCVTKSLTEFDTMYGHAKRNLDKLSKMIYDSAFNPYYSTQNDADENDEREE